MTPGLVAASNYLAVSRETIYVDNFCYGDEETYCTLDADEESPPVPTIPYDLDLDPQSIPKTPPDRQPLPGSHGREGRFPKPIYLPDALRTAAPPTA